MRRSSWLLVPAFVFATACNKGGDKAADAPGADTATAAAPAAPAAIVTVLYNTPKDAAAFEKYYTETHLPLVVANQGEIGFKRADLTKFESTLDGKKPTFYRQAELYFDSMDELQKGVATPGFKKVADDLGKFASGGLIGMVATTTNDHEAGSGEPGGIVTVIYKAPKDTVAFEKYYAETHIPLVVASQPEIGFTRAELTRFNSNLDGSKPDRYRQAELYFPSMDAAKKGIATPAFKKVGDDLANFASGGLDALLGAETK
ncbi:MAG TPA: EthD family reductase [Gemmatimonadales bacterium]|nr:EthD family reductase [Gemmatimonadales bacterium]